MVINELDNKLITIIVPIYNVGPFLGECLESLIAQTNKSFVALLINDGSTDDSGKIAEDYANRYPNLFKYYFQKNKGLGATRNNGLTHVSTKYVMFLDSDDFISPKCIENVITGLGKFGTPPEITLLMPVVYNMAINSYTPWNDEKRVNNIFKDKSILNSKTDPEILYTEGSVCRSVWLTDFIKINNLSFPESITYEDVLFHFVSFRKAERIAFLNFSGAYYYRVDSGFNQITSDTGETRLELSKIFDLITKTFKTENWTEDEIYYLFCSMQNLTTWSYRLINEDYIRPFVNSMHKVYKKMPFKICLNYYKKSEKPKKNKIFAILLRTPIVFAFLKHKKVLSKVFSLCRKIKYALHI